MRAECPGTCSHGGPSQGLHGAEVGAVPSRAPRRPVHSGTAPGRVSSAGTGSGARGGPGPAGPPRPEWCWQARPLAGPGRRCPVGPPRDPEPRGLAEVAAVAGAAGTRRRAAVRAALLRAVAVLLAPRRHARPRREAATGDQRLLCLQPGLPGHPRDAHCGAAGAGVALQTRGRELVRGVGPAMGMQP